MPKFSASSSARLATCHPDLIRLMNAVIAEIDFAVVVGSRDQKAQEAAFKAGNTKLRYPNSKHNKNPSLAVDIAPLKYHDGRAVIDWNDLKAFKDLAAVVIRHAAALKIPVRWGGDWDSNPATKNTFNDLPHFELKE